MAPASWWTVLVEVVGKIGERSSSWSTLNPNDRGRGISVGLLQFNQGAGSLGDVLAEWRKTDPAGFASWSASWAGEVAGLLAALRSPDDATRLRPRLAAAPWPQRWAAAEPLPGWRNAQAAIAWRQYFAPLQALAAATRLDSPAALALVFDRSINQGPGATKQELTKLAKEPHQRTESDRAARFQAMMVGRLGNPDDRAAVTRRCARVLEAMVARGFVLGTVA